MAAIDTTFPWQQVIDALHAAGFRGEITQDRALLAAMSSDNSIYQIPPDAVVAPVDAADLQRLSAVMAHDTFRDLPLTARGGGTGTNGQSLNTGIIVDFRRHMHRLLALDTTEGWADVEPGMVLDDLNAQIRSSGWFFAPETSTSSRCTIGGMVSTDASGKGSRIYGKTSDNLLGIEIARPEGLLDSLVPPPDWALPLLARLEGAARHGRAAFIAATPRLNRRFTGYDLERACPDEGGFEWWRLFPGSEGSLGLISKIRVKLRRIEAEKRLVVVGFDSFADALASARPLLPANPTAIEVMDERVQALAAEAGILAGLPPALQARKGQPMAYTFIEFNGDDANKLAADMQRACAVLGTLPGAGALYCANEPAEISALWAIRSAAVGLLGRVDGPARPVAFVEDCVVPPENLPAFVAEVFAVLSVHNLDFGIYGHVDVGCLHIRPALNIDAADDRQKLVAVSDAVYALTKKYGGIFWGEHGKGVRGAYLRDWIGVEAYGALQQIKAAFDPDHRFNPGKLVSLHDDIKGIATTPLRPFNAPDGDPLAMAFRCNGNAQCLSYAASTPMCPSFKATADLRQSPKGRADALRAWHESRDPALEVDLLRTLDSCLGCKACASSCPVQVDIPTMRSAFYADYFSRHPRSVVERVTLMIERLSPLLHRTVPLWGPVWFMAGPLAARMTGIVDLPRCIARPLSASMRVGPDDLAQLRPGSLVLVQDWFTALFDGSLQRDIVEGLRALGFEPRLLAMRPAGKVAQSLGDTKAFFRMAKALAADLRAAAERGAILVGMDPAFVMHLRQDYPKAGIPLPEILSPQDFLLRHHDHLPRAKNAAAVTLFTHCTETAAGPANEDWGKIFARLDIPVTRPATGCCGMAGIFGHQKRHQVMSKQLLAMSWAEHLENGHEIAATGYSCRSQVARFSVQKASHPLALIARALKET